MKSIILMLTLIPAMSFANIYSCTGNGFNIEIGGSPVAMRVVGNGINGMVENVHVSSTFDTVIAGNLSNPPSTIKLVIKDSSFGNPGDSFKASAQVSSSAGVKDFSSLVCVRGND